MTDLRHITRRGVLISGAALGLMGAAKPPKSGRVAAVTHGDQLTLSDGLVVRLAGVDAPRRSAPWGREAREALAGLVRGREVLLSYGEDPLDRYDRALAQVHTIGANGKSDLWLQEELVRLGLARVYSWPGDVFDVPGLLSQERQAREKGRGIWTHDDYAIRSPDPDPLAQRVDSVQIVEGVITSAAEVRGTTYLNFGADYRTDFTIAISRKHRRRFKSLDPMSLEGARVRVRGWLELINGPVIWATHPERIEVLS